MKTLRSIPLCALAGALFSTLAVAQSAAPAVRIVTPIDESQLVTLKGNVNPHANAANDRGPASAGLSLPDLTLVLSRGPEQQAAFDAYVAAEYDPGSANYHRWLTPAQIGAQYGPAPADIATVTGWLASHGFAVKSVSPDGMTIKFAGTAGSVQSAFHTSIHNLSVHGEAHYANMTSPQIPAALAPVVVGVKRLHNFLPKPMHKMGSLVQFNADKGKWQRVANSASTSASPASRPATSAAFLSSALAAHPKASLKAIPQYGINGSVDGSDYLEEDVTPWDFATIYNVAPAWSAGYTGSGQTIAIAGTSEICLGQSGTCDSKNDISTYRSEFDLPAGLAPIQTDTGLGPAATVCTGDTDPCNSGDQIENTLDTELSGAVATGAQIKLYVTGQIETGSDAGSIDTTYDSASYIVEHQATVGANILSLSYGECELFEGTAENVAYYDLWQSATAEGISVFVATGDSGSPACDDDLDEEYGNPYVAQYGASVNGMASTPFNTAVGGTDFSWCQPYFGGTDDDTFEGCATSSTTQGSPAYWSTSNNATTGASALGYVPEIPWNDTCSNPILARYLETFLGITGTPEQVCSYIYTNWENLDDEYYYETEGGELGIETYVDTVGGSGGASNCVANNEDSVSSTTLPTCTAGATTTGATTNQDTDLSQTPIPLVDNGWPTPAWQTEYSSIPGTSSLTTRALPDVSFFAGNGALDSATLICVQSQGSCALSSTVENTAQEVGGTSVATPEMAGVMALIDQKAAGAQGLANPGLYKLASQQTYADCSAEKATSSSSCYFQDIDNGPTATSGSAYTNAQTNAMPCALTAGTLEGGDEGGYGETLTASPNCYAMSSGDIIGTLGLSDTTAAYNSTTGFDMATGLGSLNVANVVSAWISDAGTAASTIGVVLTPNTGTLSDGQSLTVAVTMTGSGTTPPTGTIAVAGAGYSGSGTLAGSGVDTSTVTITVPAGSLAVGSDTLTITYSGDGTYASTSTTETLNVSAASPVVTVTAPASQNLANPVQVTVTVTGPAGVPTSGTVSLATGGTYIPAAFSLTSTSGGVATFTIPANTMPAGVNETLTATFGGNSSYASGTGATTITIVGTAALPATVNVTPTPTSIDTGQLLVVGVGVTGSGAIPTGTVSLTAGSYTSAATALVAGAASFNVPAGSFTAAGSPTITATYSGDAVYGATTGTATETVALSTYALAATTPATVAPGSTTTSTITGSKSTTDYTGTVTLSTCTLTSSSVTDPNSPPTCTVSGTIVYAAGAATGSGVATVSTTAASTVDLVRPKVGNGKGWLGGGGAVLAFLVFLGIPSRRKSWRAMLGMVVLLVTLGSLAACGGGAAPGGAGGTSVSATSAGTYTFTVTGTGNDAATTSESTTFTVTVN